MRRAPVRSRAAAIIPYFWGKVNRQNAQKYRKNFVHIAQK